MDISLYHINDINFLNEADSESPTKKEANLVSAAADYVIENENAIGGDSYFITNHERSYIGRFNRHKKFIY